MSASAAADLRERWLPAGAVVTQAVKLLRHSPSESAVMLPMCQPGKTFGVWTAGQPVEIGAGLLIVARDEAYGQARELACHAARLMLAGRAGTTAYVVIRGAGDVAVFEAEQL